ncbi:flagellin [Shewanella vesiculosa]|uniref:flagellin n=1 Tax=Shewanella vesiculosa TaxID=518738 RepID=UPI00384CF25D
MAISVNTNVTSMRSQNNLNSANSSLQTSMERLSSGLRINSAKDDAAGLQISNRMTSQINGIGVAVRNANDGISMAQTAEGAMQESTNILQRMRDLSLQSANGSNSDEDRGSMQKEITALNAELTRIADTTAFGGTKLLDGSFGSKTFQVGSNSNETISLSLDNVRADALGTTTGKSVTSTIDFTKAGAAAETLTFAVTDATGTYSVDVAIAAGAGTDDVIKSVNAAVGQYGINMESNGSGGATMVADNAVTGFTIASSIASDAGMTTTAAATQTLGADDSGTLGGAVNAINISTQTGAQSAIDVIDTAIAQIDSKRADIGAVQNRMNFTINNLNNIQSNVTDARSRIQDVDFAQETAQLTKQQILSQTSSAMLAQANQIPQTALSLL